MSVRKFFDKEKDGLVHISPMPQIMVKNVFKKFLITLKKVKKLKLKY